MSRWQVDRLGEGAVRLERTRPFVTYLTATPWIHIHYWNTDGEMDAQGYTEIDIVCHGCGEAEKFLLPSILQPDSMLPERNRFQAVHKTHMWWSGGKILCPPQYQVISTHDLRGKDSNHEQR